MPDLTELADAIADLDRRQRQEPASRNRPIQLYAISNENLQMQIDQEDVTVKTPPFKWSDGSSADRLIWGQGEWRSVA